MQRYAKAAWDDLPVAQPVAEAQEIPIQPQSSQEDEEDDEQPAEVDACGRGLLWVAMLLSCCTITDWSKATKATMWRSRVTLMLLYMLILMCTGIVMYVFYGGYEKLTILDDQGQRTLLLFGDGSLVDQLQWDPETQCGEDSEGITTFTNSTRLGLFSGQGPSGCARVTVQGDNPSVVFEDISSGAVLSVQATKALSATDYLCLDGLYAVRVPAPLGTGGAAYNITLDGPAMPSPVVVLEDAFQGQSTVFLQVSGGAASVAPAAAQTCGHLTLPSIPPDAMWEVALAGSGPMEIGSQVLASGRGPLSAPVPLCAPSASAAQYLVQIFASTGHSLLSDPTASCSLRLSDASGNTFDTATCGGTALQDVAVVSVSPAGVSQFVQTGCSSLSVSPVTSDSGVSDWWIVSSTGKVVAVGSSSYQVSLCDAGLYEFGLSGNSASPVSSFSLSLGSAAASERDLADSSGSLLLRAGPDPAVVGPVEGNCLLVDLLFSPAPAGTTWTLRQPPQFPQLLPGDPWELPAFSGQDNEGLRRYVCRKGPYNLTVSSPDGGTAFTDYSLGLNGDASSLPGCSDSYCSYHRCSGPSSGGNFLSNALQSVQGTADSAWEGLGNEQGSLALDVTSVAQQSVPEGCGYSSSLDGDDPPAEGKPGQDTVFFLKGQGSNQGAMLKGQPDYTSFSDYALLTAAESEEVMMYCKPIPCPSTPPPAPAAPPSASGEETVSGLFDSYATNSRQCEPLSCTAPSGEALEYQCWEAQSENTGLMAIMTVVALVVCPIGWFVIKLLGIKIEAHLIEQKEAEESGGGSCLFPCCFCLSFCGCTCGVGTLKFFKFCFTFGANAVLAINLSFAYDVANDQYFADLFAATTWLAYMTIALIVVNLLWGLCNVRDLCKSQKDLDEEDRKFGGDTGWTPSMCCQLIIGTFVMGAVTVGVFVWGAGAWAKVGHYSADIAVMLENLTGEKVLAVLKSLAMGIALIHPDLIKLPQLTPIVLQISLSVTMITGPVLFLLDLIAQLPTKLLAGICGLGGRMAQVAPFAGGAASGVSRAEAAQKLSAAQEKVGGRLAAKDDSAAKRQAGTTGLDDRLSHAMDVAQGRLDTVTDTWDGVGTLQQEGVTGLLQSTSPVQAINDPLEYGEDTIAAKAEEALEDQTLGRLDRGDAARQANAARGGRITH